jgi:predicted DNA-binding transcriptional regulator YafY
VSDVRARMLTLLSLLQNGRGWTGAELADRLGVSPRSVRRDIEQLRELGYPVTSRPGPGGRYQLTAGASVPPLLFDDGEAVAVAVGLRLATAASVVDDLDDGSSERALRKLELVLPPRLRERVTGVHAVTESAGDGRVPTVSIERLSLLGSAAHRRERVELRYRDRDGADSRRDVEPYRQVLVRGRWYLLGYDRTRDGWRTFRVDRIGEVTPTGLGFRLRPLPAESAAAYLDANLRASRHRAVVDFELPVDRVADRLPAIDGELEPLPGGGCRLTTWVDSFAWLAVRVATLGLGFRVVAPDDLVAACAELADRLDRAARGSGDDSVVPGPGPAR